MKRIILLFFCIMLSLILFGCNTKSNENSGSNEISPETNEADESSDTWEPEYKKYETECNDFYIVDQVPDYDQIYRFEIVRNKENDWIEGDRYIADFSYNIYGVYENEEKLLLFYIINKDNDIVLDSRIFDSENYEVYFVLSTRSLAEANAGLNERTEFIDFNLFSIDLKDPKRGLIKHSLFDEKYIEDNLFHTYIYTWIASSKISVIGDVIYYSSYDEKTETIL